MIIAHIVFNYREAIYIFQKFINDNKENIERIDKKSMIVLTKEKDEHHFMSQTRYSLWNKGKTYKVGNDIYHSGYIMKGDD